MAEEKHDIFKFSTGSKLLQLACRPSDLKLSHSGRPCSSSDSDDEDFGRCQHSTTKLSTAVSRFFNNSKIPKDSNWGNHLSEDDSDEIEAPTPSKKLKLSTAEGLQTPALSSSVSSLSPLLSPRGLRTMSPPPSSSVAPLPSHRGLRTLPLSASSSVSSRSLPSPRGLRTMSPPPSSSVSPLSSPRGLPLSPSSSVSSVSPLPSPRGLRTLPLSASSSVSSVSHLPSPRGLRTVSSLSPPPSPVISIISDEPQQVLNKANDMLDWLWSSDSSLLDHHSDPTINTPLSSGSMTLRIRCKGIVHKYTVNKSDPFSDVIARFTKELGAASDDKVLLSHKTTTIKSTDCPSSLGLNTASIIDAIITTDVIIEFKDRVIGLMMTDDFGSLKAVASGKKVELCPLPAPRLGFRVKGEPKEVEAVKKYCNQLRITVERNSVGYEQMVLSASSQPVCATIEVDQYRKGLEKDLKVVTKCSHEGRIFHQAGLRVTSDHVTFIRIVVGDLLAEQADAIVIPTGRAVDSCPIELPSLAMCGNSRSLESSSERLMEVGRTECLDGGKLPCSHVIRAGFPQAVNESCDFVILNTLSLATQMKLGSISFPAIRSGMVKCLVNGLCSLGPTSLHTVTIVLGKKEARVYKTVLETEIKETHLAESVKAPNSTAALPVDSSDFTWSWQEDDGSFTPYTPADTDALNKSYQKDRSGMCHLLVAGVAYAVDFTTMEQVNLSTGNQRSVRNSRTPTLDSNSSNHGSLQPRVLWKFQDDQDCFTSYSPADSAKIEAMFQQQDESGHLVIQKRQYGFDFNLMKQINVYTGFSRDVRRVLSHQSASSLVEQVVRFKPTFLSENKVVINLKGPLENLAAAKKQLERRIKALLFTKVIPVPTQVTPSLYKRLKVIAKKHRISFTTGDGTASEASNVYQNVFMLEGLESCVKVALTEVQELILQFQASSEQLEKCSQYPKEWDLMSETDSVKIVPAKSSERQAVSAKFLKTMPNVDIVEIQQVQNKVVWNRYKQCMSRLHEKNAGKVNEKQLFHGTRGEPAKKICTSEEGFDMRYSCEGMWGQANYFAVKASYSDSYAHYNETNGTNEMILARVLTGDSYYSASDITLRMPPEKPQLSVGENQLQQVRYDSVNGKTKGSVVYMTYSNDRAYPAYIITYKPSGYYHAASSNPAGHSHTASSGVTYNPAGYASNSMAAPTFSTAPTFSIAPSAAAPLYNATATAPPYSATTPPQQHSQSTDSECTLL